jgi:DNA modification methylase
VTPETFHAGPNLGRLSDVTIIHGDCIEAMRELADNSIDAVVCDPPYNLTAGKKGGTGVASVNLDSPYGRARISTGNGGGGFMGKGWDDYDAHDGGFQGWCLVWATEALRVLKPGGHIISAGGSRTYHRMACAVEDAGFEIRDCITWHFATGFPKSHNVSSALGKLPACSCDVPSEVRPVDATLPASAVGAGVGAEAASVPPAGLAANGASGIGLQVLAASASRGIEDVDTFNEDANGADLPVMLGSARVAGDAEGSEVARFVGGVEADPEALGDKVVRDEINGRATVETGSVAGNDRVGDGGPLLPLVLPLTATPGGVAVPGESGGVVSGHAGSGAVDAAISPVSEDDSAGLASVNPVAFAPSHAPNSTTERMSRCEECGGVRGSIPQGLGTALKPATEFWVVGRKPFKGNVAANVLTHGTGALNIDGCRIGTESTQRPSTAGDFGIINDDGWKPTLGRVNGSPAGRWPANVCLDSSQAAALDEQSGNVKGAVSNGNKAGNGYHGNFGVIEQKPGYADSGGASRFFLNVEADEEPQPEPPKGRWPANVVLDESQAAALDEQSGTLKSGAWNGKRNGTKTTDIYGSFVGDDEAPRSGDSGGASRFFLNVPLDDLDARFRYCAKAPKKERPTYYRPSCNCETIKPCEEASQTTDTDDSRSDVDKSSSMSLSGSRLTVDQSQPVTTSTTATATSSTTTSTTFNSSPSSSTNGFTQAANSATVNGGNPAASAASSSLSLTNTGTSPEKDGRSTDAADPAILGAWSVTSVCANCGAPAKSESHSTVKPLALMRWLVRLVTPPGGVVLDPFAGSGTTVEAALLEDFRVIGIEREADYLPMIQQRIARCLNS